MATLKGQNLRVITMIGSSIACIAGATNATITLTNNTEAASTKDDTGMAAKPVTASKSWQVQVDSMDVSDTAAMLTAIKAKTPFMLIWDEVSTTNNQTRLFQTFARQGSAYLTDGSFTFNDREISTKSITFTGSGAIDAADGSAQTTAYQPISYTRGQFVRLFLSSDNTVAPSKVISYARQLTLHVSLSVENVTTKDTTGEWQVMEPTALNYDISTNSLVRSGDSITSLVQGQTLNDIETIYESGTPVKWKIANVSGDNNRTASSTIVSGSVLVTQLQLNTPNRANAEYTTQMSGYGEYTVAA